MNRIRKYPRTYHLQGSRLQPGDEDLQAIAWSELLGRYVVVEEKMDGANAGISIGDVNQVLLQSRGHYLTGGIREKQFDRFKQWAYPWSDYWIGLLQKRYILYGEWLYAKHTIFYDRLPHYFLEFDLLDLESNQFLSTARRRELLQDGPTCSVPVLWEGVLEDPQQLLSLLGRSLYKSSDWAWKLQDQARQRGLDLDAVWQETDSSEQMEGLYIKVEESGQVVARYKYVRASFLTAVLDSGSHWLRRPILPNLVVEA